MAFLKLTLAYDGTAYAGWQVQPGDPTIQAALETAFRNVVQAEVRCVASGRTDSGVHALGQVVSAHTDSTIGPHQMRAALNAHLPPDIVVRQVQLAADGFHAIRDATGKRYRYTILDSTVRPVFQRAYAWHYPTSLDSDLMHQAAQHLHGRHDFACFQSTGSERATTVRNITDISVVRVTDPESELIRLEVAADGFLYNMVRAIVGTLVEVGRGRAPVDFPAKLIAAGDRKLAGMTAPPQGLCLVHVDYPPGHLLESE